MIKIMITTSFTITIFTKEPNTGMNGGILKTKRGAMGVAPRYSGGYPG